MTKIKHQKIVNIADDFHIIKCTANHNDILEIQINVSAIQLDIIGDNVLLDTNKIEELIKVLQNYLIIIADNKLKDMLIK